MKHHKIIVFLLLLSSFVCAEECQLINQFAIGPEGYWVERTKEGGTRQSGMLWGGRITYERIKRYGWYLGADVLYATGTLDGHSNSKSKIRSTLTDTNVEGRFGYTLQQKSNCGPYLIPFVGIGYFRETNNFRHPTPIPAHFRNTFTYIPFGFLSHLYVNSEFGIGLNFKVRYLLHHKIHVSHDPEFDTLTLHYQEHLQYRVELPLTYDTCFYNRLWQIKLTPFYEYRNYGRLANYPFDFLNTKFRLYGAYLQLVLLF